MNYKGAVLFETLLIVALLVGGIFMCHLALVKRGNGTLELLQKKRLPYDGVLKWQPTDAL